jgi:hypothetical protein
MLENCSKLNFREQEKAWRGRGFFQKFSIRISIIRKLGQEKKSGKIPSPSPHALSKSGGQIQRIEGVIKPDIG